MPNLVKRQAVLVIAGVFALNVVYPRRQRPFKRGIVRVGSVNVLVLAV
jgi:hypothetical protein